MAVFYRLHQDQSTGTKRSGKWYARAVPMACIGTRQLAEISSGGVSSGRFFSLNPFCFLTRARRKIRSRIVSPWDFLHIFLR